tara:strand:+ start:1687 stop:2565 length:879 start_codon:yes stop_codon:yes gene_type:complete
MIKGRFFAILLFAFCFTTHSEAAKPDPKNLLLDSINDKIRSIRGREPILGKLTPEDQNKLSILHRELGDFYMKQKSPLLGAIAYRKAYGLNPSTSEHKLRAGLAYAHTNQLVLSYKMLAEFLHESTNETLKFQAEQELYKICLGLGEKENRLSLWTQAVEWYERAMQYSNSPRDSLDLVDRIQTAYFKQGTFHYSQKHYLEAADNLRRALSKNTRESLRAKIERLGVTLFLNAGKHFERIEEREEAIAYYTVIRDFLYKSSAVDYARQRLKVLTSNENIPMKSAPTWLITTQ